MEVDSYSDINVGVDLVSAAVNHVHFLQTVDKSPCLYAGPVLQRAIWRYRELWLPLAVQHPDEVLSAPLDIEWVWHCHLLSPVAYQQDCLRNFQHIVDHKILDTQTYQQSLAFSEKYWNQQYPREPFQVDLSGVDLAEGQESGSRSYELSYDIEAAAGRQKVFYYQVSLPQYVDSKFLGKSLQRYLKYLFLKQKNPRVFLVPCYDMDLMWHSHMNFPICYKTVTELLLGATLNHDDSVNDRSEGSRLNTSDTRTRHLWKRTFNEHFAAFGGMFRGDPLLGKLETLHEDDTFRLVSKKIEVKFNKVEVQGHQKKHLGKFKLSFTEKSEMLLSSRYQGEKELVDFSEKLLTLKGPEFVWEHAGTIEKYVHCLESDNLHVQLSKSKSFLCCANGSELEGEGLIDLNSFAMQFTNLSQKLTEKVEVGIDTDLQVVLDMTLTLKKLGTVDLWLVPGQYENCVMPEQIEQLWGPVPLPRLPPGVENNCSVASHKLKNYKGQVEFTCRVVHSLPLMMSSVQVFYHAKMVAVAHVIGSDQIPKPEDVGDQGKCVTLDQKKGERAMIIKNTQGDWGILVGRWDGYKTGIPAKRGTRTTPGRAGIPGRPGFLTLLLYKITTKKWELLSMEDPYLTEEFRFNLSDARVDLKVGKIGIKGDKNEIAEHLALTFCVSLLHVFLQPRPANWEPGDSLEPQVNKRGVRPVRHIKAEKLSFVLAAGLLIATPSNHFIRKKVKERSNAFGAGGLLATDGHENDCRNDQDNDRTVGAIFGGDREEDQGTRTEDIVTQMMGGDQEQGEETGGTSLFDDMYGGDEHEDRDDYIGHEESGHDNLDNDNAFDTVGNSYDFSDHDVGDDYGYGDLGGTDIGNDNDAYGEDFNTFLGDFDFGSGGNEGGESGTGGGESGWGISYEDGDGGGCGGCGAGCGGGGVFGVGISRDGGGGDSGGGGGAFSGVGYSGGAFDSGDGGGGDSGGGGWLDGFSGMDTGGGDSGGGGWGDGGGVGDGSGGGGWGDGGGGGDGGGCGGCGG